MKVIEGKINGKNARVAVVVAKFNEPITQRLLDGCVDELKKIGVRDKDITVVRVPGAFEIPLAALKLARKKNIDAVIGLGAVIRGETYHFELVAKGAAYGITQAVLQTGKPIVFEVLATETLRQAQQRAQSKGRNKGREAAQAAIETLDVMKKIRLK